MLSFFLVVACTVADPTSVNEAASTKGIDKDKAPLIQHDVTRPIRPDVLQMVAGQYVRYSKIDKRASLVGPWIYAKGIDPLVDEYERAILRLEYAETSLCDLIYQGDPNAMFAPSLKTVTLVEYQLNEAEWTIDMLLEIAASDY